MDSTSGLMLSVLFGSIGLGLFVFGKKRKRGVAFACGIGLMACPYFIPNLYLLLLACVTMTVLPFVIKR
jgi:hypothetical protein